MQNIACFWLEVIGVTVLYMVWGWSAITMFAFFFLARLVVEVIFVMLKSIGTS